MARFGLHGKLIAQPGQRDALAQILIDAAKAVSSLPGCEIYFVSLDEKDQTAIYVTEVWKAEADHKASLQMPAVRALIEKGRPMVAGFGESTRLVPIGGHGLRDAGPGGLPAGNAEGGPDAVAADVPDLQP